MTESIAIGSCAFGDNSIILQGSALFLFDSIIYLLHQQHGKKLNKLSEKFQLTTTANGIGCIVKI